MIKMKDIGNFKTVPQIVADIIGGDITSLEEYFSANNINNNIQLSKHISLTPLDVALIMENEISVKWLTEHGADLNNKEYPAFLAAVRYCNADIARYVAEKGADINALNNVGTDAFKQAIFGKKYEHLQLIHDLGHTVQKYGGEAFRGVISGKNYKVLDFFISNGVDINYNKADQIYPYKPTPLCVAARYADLDMVKYLVEHGADVTIPEKDGMHPYSIAVEKGDIEMAEYLKALEPEEFHSLHNKLDSLKKYKLPKALMNFLQGDVLRIEMDSDIAFIEFFPLIYTVEMKHGRQKLLRISKVTDNYSHILLVYNPKSKCIAYYDMEHQEFADMAKFGEFIKRPAHYMEKVLDGEYLT